MRHAARVDATIRAMASDLELRCRCGAVRGVVRDVSPSSCSHAICYCRDCRAFARWLGGDILDAHGGTDIVQVAPAQVTFVAGADRLASMRLSPKGLLRWYCDGCRVPMGNMVSAKVPFVGLPVVAFVDASLSVVGKPVGLHGRFAPGGVPQGASARAPIGMILHASRLMLGWWLGGKGRPSPYFADDGSPNVAPLVLDAAVREPLYDPPPG